MTTDVCIVGGGLVGLTAAIAFSRQGRSVKLLEAISFVQHNPHELDARSIALSFSTIQIFRSLGLWQSLQSVCAPITRIHVSSAGHFGVSRLNAKDCQLDAMGYVIEYHLLIQALLAAVKKDPQIKLISAALFKSLKQQKTSVKVNFVLDENEKSVEAGLLIIADGANSSAREALGITNETVDYQQTAIVANIKVLHAPGGWAYERFTNDGPMALLPLPAQRYALVWTNKPQRAAELMAMSDEDFTQQLYDHFGHRLGFFAKLGSRSQFDLKLSRAKQLVSGQCVLIGNAANTLHPVAGQGFNLALRDIGLLFDQTKGLDLQSEQIVPQLQAYQAQRVIDQQQTAGFGNGLVQLFSNDLPLLNHLRAGALAALDICPLLKREVSWRGMGYGSGASSLMRGAQ